MSAAESVTTPKADFDTGLALLNAQRVALIAGDLRELGSVTAQLAAWTSAHKWPALSKLELARLQRAAGINAGLAARHTAQSERALNALFADERTYGADGRRQAPAPFRKLNSA
ncbi:MAG TPA: hypothetical protein PK177_03715 [Burkholderiaceae bacterium]|nr:hypothetical protein [Burkholderiaceae bacterium]